MSLVIGNGGEAPPAPCMRVFLRGRPRGPRPGALAEPLGVGGGACSVLSLAGLSVRGDAVGGGRGHPRSRHQCARCFRFLCFLSFFLLQHLGQNHCISSGGAAMIPTQGLHGNQAKGTSDKQASVTHIFLSYILQEFHIIQ